MADNLDGLRKILKTKKAVIWDFDGVVCFLDWHRGEGLDQYKERLWRFLETFDPEIRNRFKSGMSYVYEHSDYISKTFGEEALDAINKFYLEKELTLIPFSVVNEQVVRFIKSLSAEVEQYIWSNNQGPVIKSIMNKAGITDDVKMVVSRDMVKLAKPNTEGFEMIKSSTRIPLADFIFVGDREDADKAVADKLGLDFYLYKKSV